MDFDAYSHALAALALWAVLVSVLGMVSTRGRSPENRCDCGKPKRDYANPVYRAERAFMNAVEVSGPFVAATVAAVLTGAAPFVVNLLASLFIVVRVAMAFVHIRTENQSARSACFAAGLLCILALAVMAVVAAF
ncbi:MAPEG family protein [Roseobacter sp. S98]|uniref:MAPEG family protein n=1 Tax=Roseobacter algicola (ex Choi et al. 2025) (nom. illeg.) TaxID=3092138 RepID=UPI0035C6FB9C